MRLSLSVIPVVATLSAPYVGMCQTDRLSGDVSQMWHQDSDGVRARPEANDQFGDALAWGDFNNDGVLDLAVGVPGESVGNVPTAGAVNVFYGGAEIQLRKEGVQIFDQRNDAIKGAAEAGDRFGAALAAGDLNGDGIDDLAIGVPGEDVGEVKDAGAVAVLFGTPNGLIATANVLLYEGLESFSPGREAGEGHKFGAALAIGDFFGYGNQRLAVGVPGAEVEGNKGAGAVALLVPDGQGSFALARVLYQGGGKIKGRSEPGDSFGSSFAVGDFDNNGHNDLAIGAPGEKVDDGEEAGAVIVVFGSQDGILELSANVVLNQNAYGVNDEAEYGDLFGWSLAAGDFNGDGYDDLAIGAPGEDVGDIRDAGAVNVLYGDKSIVRLGAVGQLWSQNAITAPQPAIAATPRTSVEGLPKPTGRTEPLGRKLPKVGKQPKGMSSPSDPAEASDGFGTSLAAADFDTDGFDDLAIGAPREDASDVNTITGTGMDVGMVQVLYGSADNGLATGGNQIFTQETTGIPGAAESGDRFGMTLSASDWRLAVGVPGEAVGSVRQAGAVTVIYSGALKK